MLISFLNWLFQNNSTCDSNSFLFVIFCFCNKTLQKKVDLATFLLIINNSAKYAFTEKSLIVESQLESK